MFVATGVHPTAAAKVAEESPIERARELENAYFCFLQVERESSCLLSGLLELSESVPELVTLLGKRSTALSQDNFVPLPVTDSIGVGTRLTSRDIT